MKKVKIKYDGVPADKGIPEELEGVGAIMATLNPDEDNSINVAVGGNWTLNYLIEALNQIEYAILQVLTQQPNMRLYEMLQDPETEKEVLNEETKEQLGETMYNRLKRFAKQLQEENN